MSSAVAGLPVTALPSTVAAIASVVFRYRLEGTPSGMSRVTSNVHASPGGKLPPVMTSARSSPRFPTTSVLAGPQNPPAGRFVASIPGMNWSRLSPNAMAVAMFEALTFVIVNSNVVDCPAGTGSVRNRLSRVGASLTSNESIARLPVTVRPSISAVTSLDALV